MAIIKKDNINQFGVQEEYYRILNINLNLQYRFCDITVGGYASKQARMSESEPMNIRKFRAKWSEGEFLTYFTADALGENQKQVFKTLVTVRKVKKLLCFCNSSK